MGFAKLREWVGTMTGKGVSWGRDSVGRSAPAFLSANNCTPPTYLHGERPTSSAAAAVFAARSANCGPFGCFLGPVPGGESAGCVRLQWLVQQAFCLPAAIFACHTHCPSHHLPPFKLLCPRSVHLLHCALPPFIAMCARIG